MIGSKVYCLFRDGYGNPNGGTHFCEIIDKVEIAPSSLLTYINDAHTRFPNMPETHYLVRTIDPTPEIRSEDYEWPQRLQIIRVADISIQIKKL